MISKIPTTRFSLRNDIWTFFHRRMKKDKYGLCRPRDRTIHVSLNNIKDGTAFQDTFNHEILHALFPSASEEQVERAATDMTYAQLSVGIRFVGVL